MRKFNEERAIKNGPQDEVNEGFRARAREQSNIPSIFIDLNAFTRHFEEDGKILQDQLNAQYSGSANKIAKALKARPDEDGKSSKATKEEIFQWLAEKIQELGASAIPLKYGNFEVCIIAQPSDALSNKNEAIPFLAGLSKENMGFIPGTSKALLQGLGIHEGEHCNQGLNTHTIIKEGGADAAMLEWFEENGHDRTAKTAIDGRATGDGSHATNIFRDSGITIETKEDEDTLMRASNKIWRVINDTVIKKLDIENQILQEEAKARLTNNSEQASSDNVSLSTAIDDPARIERLVRKRFLSIFENEPDKFIGALDEVLTDGSFENATALYGPVHPKEVEMLVFYAKDFARAYRKQVLDPDPIPTPEEAIEEQEWLEEFPSYVQVVNAMENVAARKEGEAPNADNEKDIFSALNSRHTQSYIKDALRERYGDKLDPYIAPPPPPPPKPEQPTQQDAPKPYTVSNAPST